MTTTTCDCCGAESRRLHRVIAYGIETDACSGCCGREDDDDDGQWPVETAAKICPVFRAITGGV